MFKEIMAATEHNNLKPIQTKNNGEITSTLVVSYEPRWLFCTATPPAPA